MIAKPMLAALAALFFGWALGLATGGHFSSPWLGAFQLTACGLVFLSLLGVLMPRTLISMTERLPARLGATLAQLLERVARAEDSLRVEVCIALTRSTMGLHGRSSLSDDAVVISGDAYSVTASIGDQALFGGLSAMLRRAGIHRARVLCRPGASLPRSDTLVLTALPLWGDLRRARQLGRALRDSRALIVIGADVLDGYYSRFESLLRLRIAGLCAQRGIPSLLCSFSFNSKPDPALEAAFVRLPAGVSMLCRDSLSHERLARLVGKRVQLTADVAFNLEPAVGGRVESTLLSWLADGHRGRGPLIGWNLSPHSVQALSASKRAEAIVASATVIARIVAERDATVVLFPHDFRSIASDVAMLTEVLSHVPEHARHRVTLLAGPYTAAEVKQCCMHFDLVLTGRMHLMIAALGRDVPVMAIEYQAKFIGTLTHFGIGADHVLEGRDVYDADRLHARLIARLDAAHVTKRQIIERRPAVEEMASNAISLCLKGSH